MGLFMNTYKKSTITSIGAGIAGCYTAILLAKRGYKVEIYERASKDDICKNTSKRSFTVTFLGYGVHALKEAGLWDVIQPHLNLMDGSLTQVTKYSQPRFSRFEKDDMPYYATKRSSLMQVLIHEALKYKNITFHFETGLVSIDRYTKSLVIQNLKNKKITTVSADVILGTDGINSIVRSAIQLGRPTVHTQEYGAWSYKQIVIEKDVVKKLGLHENAMHAWTRKDAVLAAFPSDDGSFAAIMMLPKEKGKGFDALTSAKSIKAFVAKHFPAMMPIIPTIRDGILQYPEGSFVMVHTDPWYYKDFMVILGDAAHGFFPFFGQGMSAAFGDGLALIRLIDTHGDDWGKIFPLYQETRKRHMDAMGDLSKEGLARYRRNKIADYDVVCDKLELMLHRLMPKYIQPPIFLSIATDPDHTADYVEKYRKQKRILNAFGFSLLAHTLTGIIALGEEISNLSTPFC